MAEIAELTFWEWDTRTNEVFFPPEWWQQTGYALGELPLRLGELAALLHPEDRERTLADLNRFIATPTAPCEIQYRLRRKDGVYRWFAARLEPILSAEGALERVLLVHQDVTRRKEFEDQAIHLAQHDPLTGLPSRALLDQLANHMLASTRRSGGQLAVLFFDLDRFKSVNDVYGHAVGDLLLRAVARRLRDAFRAEDLVARLGGDEFIVVLANIRDSEDAARAARNAIAELTPAYPIEGLELHCVPSIGISLFPRDGETIDGLIQRADTAMYHAKQISPGRYQFVTEALNRQASTMQILETRLREGLARSEFRLVFQPVLDAQSGVVVGVEALLRWPQADGSEIAPLAFLPVAETSGLIHELGQWVFEEVCRQHRRWLDAGLPPIPIAVNVSDRQFQHQEFRPRLAATLEAAGIDPAALSLELSEAALMRDPKASRRVLGELKQLGVRLALDDFGIGCSSLSGLEELPLDRLETQPRPGPASAGRALHARHPGRHHRHRPGARTRNRRRRRRDRVGPQLLSRPRLRPGTGVLSWARPCPGPSSPTGIPSIARHSLKRRGFPIPPITLIIARWTHFPYQSHVSASSAVVSSGACWPRPPSAWAAPAWCWTPRPARPPVRSPVTRSSAPTTTPPGCASWPNPAMSPPSTSRTSTPTP